MKISKNIVKIISSFTLATALIPSVGAATAQDFKNIDIVQTSSDQSSASHGSYEYLSYQMYPYGIEITDCSEDAVSVEIPSEINGSPVVSIGANSFSESYNLEKIEIPESVTSIGDRAFYNCEKLSVITLPDSVERIGSDAFSGTEYYNNDNNWTDGALYINNHLIEAAYNISSSYEIKPGTVSIASNAFSAARMLSMVTIPGSVVSIGDYAFYGCSYLRSAAIPEGVKYIGESAFRSCSLAPRIIIPDSVVSIGDRAFYDNSQLIDVTIGGGVTDIGSEVFENCGQLDSAIYKAGHDRWNNLNISENNSILLSKINFTYSIPDADCALIYAINDGKATISGFTGSPIELEIPDSIQDEPVTSIGENAFWDCDSLIYIKLPDGAAEIREGAFENCSSLTDVEFGSGLTYIGKLSFSSCPALKSITIPESVTEIYERAFSSCSNLSEIILPDGAIDIGESAFAGTAYYKDPANWTDDVLYIGDCLIQADIGISGGYAIKPDAKSIADYAFYGCANLTDITIPDSVERVGEYAFRSCSALENAQIGTGLPGVSTGMFFGCGKLSGIQLLQNIKYIGDGAFAQCGSLTDITIPSSVRTIGGEAFYYCGLESLTVEDGVVSIGDGAFSACEKLDRIELPDSVSDIGRSAFANTAYYNNDNNWSDSLLYIGNCLIECRDNTDFPYVIYESREIRPGTATIADYAFYDREWLDGVTIPDGVVNIGDYAFANCVALKALELPDSVKTAGIGAFADCSNLENIKIGRGLNSIGDSMFANCRARITIPPSVKSIASNAFGVENYDITIIGRGGSCAEEYAEANNLEFWYMYIDAKISSVNEEADGGYAFELSISNYTGYDITDAKIVLAAYEDAEANCVKDIKTIDYSAKNDEEQKITVNIDAGENPTLKLFIWESIDSLSPLEDPIELTVN